MRSRILAACVMLAVTCQSTRAQDTTELIPSDGGLAILVRNVAELRTKGDRFLEETKARGIPRLSMLLPQLYQFLNVQGIVDETRPGGVVVVSGKSVGIEQKNGFPDIENLLVLVVPFNDAKSLAKHFGRPQNNIEDGEAITVNLGVLGQGTLLVKGKHFFFSKLDKSAKHAANSKRISKILSKDERSTINNMDVVVQFGTLVWGQVWNDLLKEAGRTLGETQDPREKRMAEKIVKAMNGLRQGIGGLRLEPNGVSVDMLSLWDGEQKEVGEVLKLLRYGDTPTKLNGLPKGNVVMAESAKGNGVANAMLARVLFKSALQKILGVEEIASKAERPLLIGLFNELWYNLQGNQLAVYQNAKPKEQGQVTALAIVDTKNGMKFYQHMVDLAKLASSGEDNAATINQWTMDLVSQDGRVVDLAYLRLRLLGMKSALALKAATKAGDKKLASAAKDLLAEIKTLHDERQQGLRNANVFQFFRPTFTLSEKTEKYGKATGHILTMNLPGNDLGLDRQLELLFGPNWRQVRMVPVGKKVIVMIGSDTSLISQTIDRLENEGKSLANAPMLKEFYKLSNDDRRVEIHLALERLWDMSQRMVDNLTAKEPPALSSIGLSVRSDRLQLSIWVPVSEAKIFFR